jgi:23S rRNA (guanosine2251-2'-O)-methyltransferase
MQEGTDRKRDRRRRADTRSEQALLPGRRPVLEVLRASRPLNRIFIADNLRRSQVLGEIRRLAIAASIPIRVVPRAEIDRLVPDINHQGVVAETARIRYAPLPELLSVADPALIFLDGITDPQNLGSLLRSAEGAGIDGLVLPAHRSVGVTSAVRRVSAGASEFVPTARVSSLAGALDEARSAGLWIVGLDGAADAVLWDSKLFDRPVGVVLGAEDRGLSKSVRARCDGLVRIPQLGRLGSLNVAVAGALAMFEVARRDSATLRN